MITSSRYIIYTRFTAIMLAIAFLCLNSLEARLDEILPIEERAIVIEKELLEEINNNPEDIESRVNYVRFLNRQGKRDEAVLILRTFPKPTDPQAYYLLAETYAYAGDIENAREFLNWIMDDAPDNVWRDAQEIRMQLAWWEGQYDDALEISNQIIDRIPENTAARITTARVHLLRGEYDEAENSIDAGILFNPSSIALAEMRAEIFDARGLNAEAYELRRSLVSRINMSPPDTVEELLAGSAAMRLMKEPKAANQLFQIAWDHAPAHPNVLFERIRLYRSTHALIEAQKIGAKLIKLQPTFLEAYEEQALTFVDMNVSPQTIYYYCNKTLAFSPERLQPRILKAYFAIVSNNWSSAQILLDENIKHNPNDRETQRLKNVLRFFTSESPIEITKADEACLIGEIFAARSQEKDAFEWLQRAHQLNPSNFGIIHRLGIVAFRCGELNLAYTWLEQAFNDDPFDWRTKNLLDFLDNQKKDTLSSNEMFDIFYRKKDELIAEYTRYLIPKYWEIEQKRYAKETGAFDARVHLCSGNGDLGVITSGIPSFGCGGTSSDLQGSLAYPDDIYVQTPTAVSGLNPVYRFDEALYRAVAHRMALKALGPKAPLWIREGMTGLGTMQQFPDTMPPSLSATVTLMRDGGYYSLPSMESLIVNERNVNARTAAALIIQATRDILDEESFQTLLTLIANGESWQKAYEKVFDTQIDEISNLIANQIIKRYPSNIIHITKFSDIQELAEQAEYSDDARLELASIQLEFDHLEEAEMILAPILLQDTPPAKALALAGKIAFRKSNYEKAKALLEKAQAIESLKHDNSLTADDFEIFGLVCHMLGNTQQAQVAFRKSLEMNPDNPKEYGPAYYLERYAKETTTSKEEIIIAREQLLATLRNNASIRIELGEYYLSHNEKEKALQLLQSAAGIQPTLLTIHHNLAPLARELGDIEQSLASWTIISHLQPKNKQALQARSELLEELGQLDEAIKCREKIAAIEALQSETSK